MADVGAAPPEVYRLSMEKLPFAVARARRLAVLQTFVAGTTLTALLTRVSRTPAAADDAALIIGTVALVALPYIVWRAGRRLRRHWNAFELAIGGTSVRVAAKGEGRVIIPRAEIAEIVEGVGGLVVRSSQPGVSVRVPRNVEGYVDARRRLDAWHTIAPRRDALAACVASLAVGTLGAATASLWGRAPGLVTGLVLCDLAAAVCVALELSRHPRLGRPARRRAVLVIVVAALLPIASVIRFGLLS